MGFAYRTEMLPISRLLGFAPNAMGGLEIECGTCDFFWRRLPTLKIFKFPEILKFRNLEILKFQDSHSKNYSYRNTSRLAAPPPRRRGPEVS